MHAFTDLVDRCTTFTLDALRQAQIETIEKLQTSAATTLVKSLQMVNLQKAISAVGMFSMFEAILQDGLGCENGFKEARKILSESDEQTLAQRFSDFCQAINVLKHGRGDSYNQLLKRWTELPFRIKRQDENFFFEGDVSEVSTLIEVDDIFVNNCALVIYDVSVAIRKVHSDFFG